ncbi:MAG: hypothetical protein U0V72_13410 [Cytophagales bacterium]
MKNTSVLLFIFCLLLNKIYFTQNQNTFILKNVTVPAYFSEYSNFRVISDKKENFFVLATDNSYNTFFIKYHNDTWEKSTKVFSDTSYLNTNTNMNFICDDNENIYFTGLKNNGRIEVCKYSQNKWENLNLPGLPQKIYSLKSYCFHNKIYLLCSETNKPQNNNVYVLENNKWSPLSKTGVGNGEEINDLICLGDELILKLNYYSNKPHSTYKLNLKGDKEWEEWKYAYKDKEDKLRCNKLYSFSNNLYLGKVQFNGTQQPYVYKFDKEKWSLINDEELNNAKVRFYWLYELNNNVFYFYENEYDNKNIYFKIWKNNQWTKGAKLDPSRNIGQIDFDNCGNTILMKATKPNFSENYFYLLKLQ